MNSDVHKAEDRPFDWAGLGWLFLFFWYFSGVTQLLIQVEAVKQ